MVYDLGKWKELPVKGGVGAKIKYIFGRDNRPWSLASVLGVLLLIGIVIAVIYFIVKGLKKGNSSSMSGSTIPTGSGMEQGGLANANDIVNNLQGGFEPVGTIDSDLLSGEFPFIHFD